jgi:hypothetical protein
MDDLAAQFLDAGERLRDVGDGEVGKREAVAGPDGLHLNASFTRRSLVVYGLVGDEITSVDVLVGGESHSAHMGENAFGRRFVETSPGELEAIVLHRRDGTESRIPIGLHGGSAGLDNG